MTGTARVAAADRTPQLPRARKRRVRTPLETIKVALATDEAADHSGWRDRLVAIGEVPSRVLRFASWYRPAVERWVASATEQSMWVPTMNGSPRVPSTAVGRKLAWSTTRVMTG